MKGILLKQNKTKICLLFGIILLLATCASLAMVTTTAKAESNGKLIFNLINSGTEYDVCIDDKSQTRVVIPSTYKDKPVTKICNSGFAYRQNLKMLGITQTVYLEGIYHSTNFF